MKLKLIHWTSKGILSFNSWLLHQALLAVSNYKARNSPISIATPEVVMRTSLNQDAAMHTWSKLQVFNTTTEILSWRLE